MRKRLTRVRTEDGIVALMTLLFMMFVGFTSLFILWGLSYTSGAYTTLYGATQAAAYAAASQVDLGSGALGQPPFDCGAGWDSSLAGSSPACNDGRTPQAARNLLASQFPCNDQSPYGLHYCSDGSGNVKLGDGSFVSDGVLAYEIAIAPGAAQQADPSCNGFTVISAAESPDAQRTCWQSPFASSPTSPYGENAVGGFNYSSGVVVVTTASIPFVPGCISSQFLFCPQIKILVAVPASVGQQQPFTGTN